MFILILNAMYWKEHFRTYKETSADGIVGKSIIGIIILGLSVFLLFNLDVVLN